MVSRGLTRDHLLNITPGRDLRRARVRLTRAPWKASAERSSAASSSLCGWTLVLVLVATSVIIQTPVVPIEKSPVAEVLMKEASAAV